MSMKASVLDRFEEKIKEVAQLEARIDNFQKQEADRVVTMKTLNADLAVARQELDRVRDRRREIDKHNEGDRFIAELYRAADQLVRTRSAARRKDAVTRLVAAIDAATDHVDLIPF